MSQFLSTIHANRDGLIEQADRLQSLARAFQLTGNPAMAESLNDIGHYVNDAAEAIQRAAHQRIQDDLRESQIMSATVLKSALAGATVAQREPYQPSASELAIREADKASGGRIS